MFGNRSDKIREKLITEGDKLTLQKTIEICQSYEYAQKQLTEMKNDRNVESVKTKAGSNQKPRPPSSSSSSSSSAAAAAAANTTSTTTGHQSQGKARQQPKGTGYGQPPPRGKTCQNCAGVHQKGKCPAHGKQCHLCKKWNHFASACRSRSNIHDIDFDRSENASCESVFVSSVETEVVNGQAFAEIGVGPKQHPVRFKIDSGSQVDILPLSIFQKVGTKGALKHSNLQLRAYNSMTLTTEGTITL